MQPLQSVLPAAGLHLQSYYGWQDYVGNGAISGTTGESRRLEAIKIRLRFDTASDRIR